MYLSVGKPKSRMYESTVIMLLLPNKEKNKEDVEKQQCATRNTGLVNAKVIA